MKVIRLYLALLFSIALSACGGGSSSSGSGDNGGTMYSGSASFSGSGGGYTLEGNIPNMTILIAGKMATVRFGGESGSAPVSADGKRFAVPVTWTESRNGITCTVSPVFNGEITEFEVTGPITGGGTCSGPGPRASVRLSGNFRAGRSGTAKASTGDIKPAMELQFF